MITRENYEVFYIDFLDGSLSEEMEAAFLSFLEANPDLQLEDELPTIHASVKSLSAFEKELLKKEESNPLIISAETIEFALVSQLEGQLSADEEKNLNLWLLNNPSYQKEQSIYAKTKLEPVVISFENKNALYQHTRIIPLWLTSTAAAASIALIVGISALYAPGKWNVTLPGTPTFSKYQTEQDTNNTKENSENKAEEKNSNSNSTFQSNKKYSNPNQKNAPLAENNYKENTQDNTQKEQAPNKNMTNNQGKLFPNQPEIADRVTEKTDVPQANNELGSYVAYSSMNNPIEPITNGLSKQFKTDIDFRRQKETKESDPSGFYLKIGKFELMHKKGGKK